VSRKEGSLLDRESMKAPFVAHRNLSADVAVMKACDHVAQRMALRNKGWVRQPCWIQVCCTSQTQIDGKVPGLSEGLGVIVR
jgi:hypothetical protein